MDCFAKGRSAYLQFLPLAAFVFYGRISSSMDPWSDAFIFAGFCSLFVWLFFEHYNLERDRLLLGMNLFFLLGGYAFLFSCEKLLLWYGDPVGVSFFSCVALVGLLTTLFSQPGFIGVMRKKSQAVQYASFLLFGATVIALIWSVQVAERGWFSAVLIPFVLLFVVRRLLITQMD